MGVDAEYGNDEADERIIPIDSLPRVMSGGEWWQVEAGLTQRLKALNRFLEDVYGQSRSTDIYGVPSIISAFPIVMSRTASRPARFF